MNRRLISLILFLLVLSTSIPFIQALSNRVNDNAGLMTLEEIVELEALSEIVSSSTGLDIVILTVNDLGGRSPTSYADSFYDSNGYSDDGMLFLLAMAERAWYISTCGEAIRIFNDSDIETLLDAGLPWFSGGEYFEGFCEVIHNVDEMTSGRSIRTSTHTASSSAHRSTVSSRGFFISMLVGAAVSCIVVLIMRSSMNTKRKQRGATDYLIPGSYHLRTQQDIFLYSNVTKTPRQQNTSSGSSSHMSFSGRSHGGGGTKF